MYSLIPVAVHISIKTDRQKQIWILWEKTWVFHEVALDDTSLGFRDLWDKVTSWLPNLEWLQQLLMGLITLMVLEILVCISLKCFLWCCQNSVETHSDWKRNKIRHQIETGKYFSRTLGMKDNICVIGIVTIILGPSFGEDTTEDTAITTTRPTWQGQDLTHRY